MKVPVNFTSTGALRSGNSCLALFISGAEELLPKVLFWLGIAAVGALLLVTEPLVELMCCAKCTLCLTGERTCRTTGLGLLQGSILCSKALWTAMVVVWPLLHVFADCLVRTRAMVFLAMAVQFRLGGRAMFDIGLAVGSFTAELCGADLGATRCVKTRVLWRNGVGSVALRLPPSGDTMVANSATWRTKRKLVSFEWSLDSYRFNQEWLPHILKFRLGGWKSRIHMLHQSIVICSEVFHQ